MEMGLRYESYGQENRGWDYAKFLLGKLKKTRVIVSQGPGGNVREDFIYISFHLRVFFFLRSLTLLGTGNFLPESSLSKPNASHQPENGGDSNRE